MMSYRLESSNQLKSLFPQMGLIPGMISGTPIEISNNQCTFYTIYTPDPKQNAKHIIMSEDFLNLNSIPEGYYNVQSVSTDTIKSLNVTVSKIHWEIIGDRVQMIQELFFNQARLVWNGLVIPLFYNQNEKVDLKCECEEGVWELKENSELKILPEKEELVNNQQLNIKEEVYFQVQKEELNVSGYGNQFYLSQRTIKQNGIDQNVYYSIFPQTEQEQVENISTFKEYISNKNKKSTQVPAIPIYAKFKQGNPNHEQLIKQNIAITPKIFANSFKVPQTIKFKQQFKEDEDHISTTNQYFMSSQSKVYLMFIPVAQNYDNFDKDHSFYSKLINESNIFYNNKIYKIEQKYFLTKIQKFNKQSNVISQIKILKINAIKAFDQKFIKKQASSIQKKIKFLRYGMYLSITTQQQKAKHSQLINSHLHSLKQDKSITVYNLFQTFYQNQIHQILKMIQKKQNILVLANNKNGKTFLNFFLNYLKVKTFYLDFQQINNSSTKITDILGYIQTVFQEYGSKKIIFIDNVHCLCKVIENDMHRQQQIVASKIITRSLLEWINLHSQYPVIMTTTQLQIVEPQLISQSINHIYLKNPSGQHKRNIISNIQSDIKKVNQITQYVQGMSFHQFFTKVSTKQKLNNFYDNQVLKIGKQRQVNDFTKVAGLKQAKKVILETIQTPFKYSSLYKNLDIKLPRGILLYGPSGVGKTFLANSIMDQTKMKFFEIKGSDILNKYIGASEQAVRDIFQKAASVSPSVIFFDQFQSIVPRRNSDNTSVNDRVVNQFLCYLDGVSSIDGVFIVAASSRPQMIDPALLRPGRIDKHIYLEYPNEQQRQQILAMFSKSIKFQFDVKIVVDQTNNYSYSDMIGLIKELRIKKSNEVVKKQPIDRQQFKKISLQFFQNIIKGYRIAVNVKEQEQQSKRFKKSSNKQPQQIKNQKTILA